MVQFQSNLEVKVSITCYKKSGEFVVYLVPVHCQEPMQVVQCNINKRYS